MPTKAPDDGQGGPPNGKDAAPGSSSDPDPAPGAGGDAPDDRGGYPGDDWGGDGPEPEDITLVEPFQTVRELAEAVQSTPFKEIQERGRAWIARGIVWIFGTVLIAILLLIGVVLIVADDPQEAADYAAAMTPLLAATRDLGTALFSPLLAFILGYYFKETSLERAERG